MCHKCIIVFTNRSESPSQVFLILLQWLLSLVKTLGGPSNLPAITVAYDNICNIEKMRIAWKPLPLPPPYNKLWMNVQKIIDVFHFPNHITATCREQFSPLQFKESHPNFNTQCGEQTFAWVGRYKCIYVQWLGITTCFIYTEWCCGVIYTLLDAIGLVVNQFCPRNHSMYCNCPFVILVFLVCTQFTVWFILWSSHTYRRDYCAWADWDAAACRRVYWCAVQFPSVSINMGKELVQYDSHMGYWKGKGESKRFVPLTNFAMNFIKFVRSPEQLPDYAGFIRITEGSV